jgi:hypothetical protein
MNIQYADNGDDIVKWAKEAYADASDRDSGYQPRDRTAVFSIYDFRDMTTDSKRRTIILKADTNGSSLIIHKEEDNTSQWETRDDLIAEAADSVYGGLELTAMRAFLNEYAKEPDETITEANEAIQP